MKIDTPLTEDWIKRRPPIKKHGGPGPHASGTEQSVHGRGGTGTVTASPDTQGTGTETDPIRTGDVQEALHHLSEGRYVELTQPRQVSTLLDKMAEYVRKAEAAGGQDPQPQSLSGLRPRHQHLLR